MRSKETQTLRKAYVSRDERHDLFRTTASRISPLSYAGMRNNRLMMTATITVDDLPAVAVPRALQAGCASRLSISKSPSGSDSESRPDSDPDFDIPIVVGNQLPSDCLISSSSPGTHPRPSALSAGPSPGIPHPTFHFPALWASAHGLHRSHRSPHLSVCGLHLEGNYLEAKIEGRRRRHTA